MELCVDDIIDKYYNKQIALFVFVLFILLSICSPGVFLNDEWVFTNQLHQLNNGSDLTYNEGKYGYFENGEISNYFSARNNVLVYSLGFSLISYPFHLLFTFMSGGECGGDISLFFKIIYLCAVFYLLYFVLANIFEYDWLQYLIASVTFIGFTIWVMCSGQSLFFIGLSNNIPSEVLTICFVNIVLFSLLSVVVYNITKYFFNNDTMQLFVTFCALFTGSLMFWATTCKDHVLIALVVALIVLMFLKSKDGWKYYIVAVGLSGLLMWIRPEVGFGIFIANILYILFISDNVKGRFITFFAVYPLSLIPFFINNYIITGNVLKHPFLLGNSQYGETCVNSIGNIIIVNPSCGNLDLSWIMNCINTFIMPYNGGLNLILPFGIFICSVFYIRKNISKNELILLIFGGCSIIYHSLSIFGIMHMDNGILPDMRYYSQFYVIATIFGMSLLYRNIDMNPKKMIYWLLLSIGFFTPMLLFISNIFIDVFGSSYTGFIQLCNVFGIILMLLIFISLLSYRNNKKERKYEIFIPAIFGLMVVLQIVLIIVYSDVKMNGYGFLTPIGDLLYGLVFIG